MNERLKELRIALGMSQEEIGKRLGVTRGAISRIESGSNSLTPSMQKSICREFSVNEEWLRTGTGSMYMEMSRAELAAKIVGNAMSTDDEFILNTFIALGQMSPQEWRLVKSFMDKIKSS